MDPLGSLAPFRASRLPCVPRYRHKARASLARLPMFHGNDRAIVHATSVPHCVGSCDARSGRIACTVGFRFPWSVSSPYRVARHRSSRGMPSEGCSGRLPSLPGARVPGGWRMGRAHTRSRHKGPLVGGRTHPAPSSDHLRLALATRASRFHFMAHTLRWSAPAFVNSSAVA